MVPLRNGTREALTLTGSAPAGALQRSPLVVDVDGTVAVDLELLGFSEPVGVPLLRRLDPRPNARRLRASWRVGRLRASLPALAREVITQVDRDLAAVPRLTELDDRMLLTALRTGQSALATVHAYEALAGLLVPTSASSSSGASVALDHLRAAQRRGLSPEQTIVTSPTVLSLVPPRIGGGTALPPVSVPPIAEDSLDPYHLAREVLRLRARWIQELTSRTAEELGRRLVIAGALTDASSVRLLRHAELVVAVTTGAVPDRINARDPQERAEVPSRFRFAEDGTPMPATSRTQGGPSGAGGGIGTGPADVVMPGRVPEPGSVLVVKHLDPRLAAWIPSLRGLVAETGSPLSHLAILAREHRVPTVVGVQAALDRYPVGATLRVDGDAGTITVVEKGARSSIAEHLPARQGAA